MLIGRWKRSPLERAIIDAAQRPSEDSRAALLQHLGDSALFVAIREPVALDVDESGVLRSTANLAVLTGSGPNAPVLLGFTSERQVRRRKADAHPLLLPVKTICELVVQQNYNGLVINPEDKWVFVSREELRAAVGRANPTR
ncbi:MAG: SseB family protein [Myxococcota bacterium]